MDATILKIDPNHLRFDKMSNSKRLKLRRENIKALIRSKPAGTLITIEQFQQATQASYQGTYGMLKTLMKKGQIKRVNDDHFKSRYSWLVVEDAKVTTPAKPKTVPPVGFDTETITEKAKSYAWQYDDDSLRGFVKWLEGGEKPCQTKP